MGRVKHNPYLNYKFESLQLSGVKCSATFLIFTFVPYSVLFF